MMQMMYFSIALGVIIFLFLIFVLILSGTFRKRLKEKEKELLELYESIESVMDSFQEMARETRAELEEEKQQLRDWVRDTLEDKKEKRPPACLTAPEVVPGDEEGYARVKPIRQAARPAAPVTKRQRIQDLQRQGLSVTEIARELRIGQGEARLVLDMFDDGNYDTPSKVRPQNDDIIYG